MGKAKFRLNKRGRKQLGWQNRTSWARKLNDEEYTAWLRAHYTSDTAIARAERMLKASAKRMSDGI